RLHLHTARRDGGPAGPFLTPRPASRRCTAFPPSAPGVLRASAARIPVSAPRPDRGDLGTERLVAGAAAQVVARPRRTGRCIAILRRQPARVAPPREGWGTGGAGAG